MGADLIGFSRIDKSTYLREDYAEYLLARGYNHTISLACRISVSACDLLLKRDDEGSLFYFDRHNTSVTEKLERAAQEMSLRLESLGFHAFVVPGKGRAYPGSKNFTILSHIAQARLAGLGTMGDSGMLITPQYGPRVRLSTIVTDCPLPILDTLPQDFCIHCGLCAAICPSSSIDGRRFDPTCPAAVYTDKEACDHFRDGNLAKYGSRFCNLCMAVCPIGKNISDNINQTIK